MKNVVAIDMVGFGVVDTRTVVFAAVLAAIGILLIIAGWAGAFSSTSPKPQASDSARDLGIRIGLATLGALALHALTGWIMAGFFGAVAGWFFLTLKNAKTERRAAIERVDAIATWVENIRDNISGSAGLQQALRMSGNYAPEPVRTEVRDLVLRLQHEPVVTALRQFAADVAHPTADMAVGSLILASSRSAGSLASVLANTAQAARDSAAMLRHVEAGRSASLSQAKLVAAITGLVTFLMITSQNDFLTPYDSFGGQIALFVVCSMLTGSGVMLYRLAKPAEQQRVFRGVESSTIVSDSDEVHEVSS